MSTALATNEENLEFSSYFVEMLLGCSLQSYYYFFALRYRKLILLQLFHLSLTLGIIYSISGFVYTSEQIMTPVKQ